MLQRGLIRTFLLLGLLMLGSVSAFGACGGDDNEKKTTTTASPTPATKIDISKVPELKDGVLLIGSDIAYPPIESYAEGTQNEIGLDIDLAKALTKELGVEVKFEQVADFGGIVGDLKSKRYDIIMSAISITPEREAEIDFIPYFGPVGTGILVPKGNPKNLKTLEGLCGLKVAAQQGTYQVTQMKALNDAACKDNPIDIQTFPDNPAAIQELQLGRVVAELADDPVAAYSALQTGGEVVLAAPGFEAAPYGIGVRKDSPALQAVLLEALTAIMDSGEYDRILEKWGQTEFALQ